MRFLHGFLLGCKKELSIRDGGVLMLRKSIRESLLRRTEEVAETRFHWRGKWRETRKIDERQSSNVGAGWATYIAQPQSVHLAHSDKWSRHFWETRGQNRSRAGKRKEILTWLILLNSRTVFRKDRQLSE